MVNSSPLIYLGKIGLLELLPNIFDQVITSKIVKKEVLIKAEPEFTILLSAFNSWLKIKQPENKKLVSNLMATQIHRGEAEVIAIAKQLSDLGKKNIIIIDDLAARDIARTLGLNITGTIGVLVRAQKLKLRSLKQTKQSMNDLVEETDFRISVDLYSKILSYLEKGSK
ncbi:MAG: DUF3368 domain-containing protein [Candidatus Thorarchaeota archaeon]